MSAGFLVIDKPGGMTSRDAVDHAQRWFPKLKMGHAGTLDPSATGVLVLGVGAAATRLIEYVQRQEKVYRSTFTLGATSTTDDGDGTITPRTVARPPSLVEVMAALKLFLGNFDQVPPAYSAALVQGQRAYSKARRGEAVTLAPRAVHVTSVELLRYDYPVVEVEVTCGKGTYIRSIARDLGEALGTGGYVSTLRRTRIGAFALDLAVPWEATAEAAQTRLQPLLSAVKDLPRVVVTDDELTRLRQGQWLRGERAELVNGEVALLVGETFVGLGTYDVGQRWLRPSKMIQAG